MTLTSSIHFVFLPLEMKKVAPADQIKALVFLLCLKVASAKTFSPVYMLLVHLALMNVFILCDIWNTLNFVKIYRYS